MIINPCSILQLLHYKLTLISKLAVHTWQTSPAHSCRASYGCLIRPEWLIDVVHLYEILLQPLHVIVTQNKTELRITSDRDISCFSSFLCISTTSQAEDKAASWLMFLAGKWTCIYMVLLSPSTLQSPCHINPFTPMQGSTCGNPAAPGHAEGRGLRSKHGFSNRLMIGKQLCRCIHGPPRYSQSSQRRQTQSRKNLFKS